MQNVRRVWPAITVLILAVFLGCLRWLLPERPPDYTGPRAVIDAGFALGTLALILLLAASLGQKVLRWLELSDLTRLEQILFGITVGLGMLAYGVFALGLLGLLRPWVVAMGLVVASAWTWRDWEEIVYGLPGWLKRLPQGWPALEPGKKALLALGGLIFGLALLQALTPPWEYDALMYHLQGPREFLAAGRLVLLPDNWPVNYPSTVEMLFTLGLAFGSDTFARLMHLACAVLLVLSTFAFGQRNLKAGGKWIAAAILVGIPIFPVWASLAYADMTWALFQFLGLYALTLWLSAKSKQWLVLSGLLMGLALGSKYFAVGSAAVLGLAVLWYSRTSGWRAVLQHGALFGVIALLVGSPWYLKNWLATGNPVYPLFFGGPGWTAERLDWLMLYHSSFGTGHTIWDYVLLPWNLYAHHERFGTVNGSIEMPSLLFPAALLYPLTRKTETMNLVAKVTLLWFVVWAAGVQQVRYLLPLFPALSLLVGAVLVDLTDRVPLQRLGRALVAGLVGGMVVATLLYSFIFLSQVRPLAVVAGMESKDSFLRRTVNDYAALQFIQTHLSRQSRVLMMWDAQGYYCDERCLPDAEHSRWTRLTGVSPDVASVSARLREMGVTHLLFTLSDADFILQHDPTGRHRRAADFFLQEFRTSCTRQVYRDKWAMLVQLTCDRADLLPGPARPTPPADLAQQP